MKKIAILGSTGSIGTQALDIIRKHPDAYRATTLSCGKNIELLKKQIEEFSPLQVVVESEEDAKALQRQYKKIDVSFGSSGLLVAASQSDSDMVLNSLVGMMGLKPTYTAIKKGKQIALANKETLVAGGALIMDAVKENKVKLLPVDSEHSAIFQSLQGNKHNPIKKIILTASGGPFRNATRERLEQVSLEEALKHPNWTMGSKITIDSATLMNKGLEVIEARWLFDTLQDKIEVVVHPQSIIHSMVEYEDHSVIGQLGLADMRIPIAYAFSYPNRLISKEKSLDLTQIGQLTFEKPDMKVFECLQMAYDALDQGHSSCVVLNAANEELVKLFLEKKISFIQIQDTIKRILEEHKGEALRDIDSVIELDQKIRQEVRRRCH